MTNATLTGPSPSLSSTQPPTQSADSLIVDLIIYVFAAMCASNQTCTSVFRIFFALLVELFSIFVATLPFKHMQNSYDYYFDRESQKPIKALLFLTWLASNVGGFYAAKAVYNHELPISGHVDTIDQFEIVSDALFAGAIVTTAYTAMSACLITAAHKPILIMHDSCAARCRELRNCSRPAVHDSDLSSGLFSSHRP
jgi:hypothetical protein